MTSYHHREPVAMRGRTKQWSRPRQWQLCGMRVSSMARRLTASVRQLYRGTSVPNISIALVLVAILLVGAAVSLWGIWRRAKALRTEHRINASIAIVACLGGLIS